MSFFLQESLLEIDEEEDTTDFGQAFFASHSQQQTEEHQAPQPQSQPQQPLMAKITHSIPWWPSSLIPSRQSQHNKDIKLIGRDGGVQIGRSFIISGWIQKKKKSSKVFLFFADPLILASCLPPSNSSFLSQHLSQVWGETTLLLPDIHLHELQHLMTLIHQVCTYYRMSRQVLDEKFFVKISNLIFLKNSSN